MGGLRVEGSSFFVAGRFERLPKSRVERELAGRGAKLHRRLNRNTDFAVVTHEAAGRIASPAFATLRALEPARCLSEETFLRALGLAPTLQGKDIEESRLLSLTGLGPEDVRLLSLFDVLTPAGGQFGFNDLKVAQHIAHLRRRQAQRAQERLLAEAALGLRRTQVGEVRRRDAAGRLVRHHGEIGVAVEAAVQLGAAGIELALDAAFRQSLETAGDKEAAAFDAQPRHLNSLCGSCPSASRAPAPSCPRRPRARARACSTPVASSSRATSSAPP